jgi:hypothetical protein
VQPFHTWSYEATAVDLPHHSFISDKFVLRLFLVLFAVMDLVFAGLNLELGEEKNEGKRKTVAATCKCVSIFFVLSDLLRFVDAPRSFVRSCAIFCARLMRATRQFQQQRGAGPQAQLLPLARLPIIVSGVA